MTNGMLQRNINLFIFPSSVATARQTSRSHAEQLTPESDGHQYIKRKSLELLLSGG